MLIGNLVKRVARKKCTRSDRDEWYHSKHLSPKYAPCPPMVCNNLTVVKSPRPGSEMCIPILRFLACRKSRFPPDAAGSDLKEPGEMTRGLFYH